MSDPERWHALCRPAGKHGIEVVAVYRSEQEAIKAQENTGLGHIEADDRPEIGERWFIREDGRELEGAFTWKHVPARCVEDRLVVGDSVKIHFHGDRDNPRDITAYPAGRTTGSGDGTRHVVVERDARPDGVLTHYGRIVSEHGASLEDALLASLHRERELEIQQARGPSPRPGHLADVFTGEAMRAVGDEYRQEGIKMGRGYTPER